ncbi:MAG: response regulator transcription factor [Pseudomonadales bacterium]|nr:response regulator transcription factor [Pseudomonadales bacterium]
MSISDKTAKTLSNPNRVLIVEDNADSLSWLVKCVNTAFPKANVVTGIDVSSALDLVKQYPIDIALIDLGLPDGSGLQVIHALRQSTKSKQVYIVVATIYEDDKHLFSALKTGAQGYILKDQDREKIVSFLHGIAEGIPPISDKVTKNIISHFNAKGEAAEDVHLAPREQDVLKLIAKGFSVSDSANILGLTGNTVKGYVKTIYSKLGIGSRAEATVEAIRLGLVDLD